MMSVLAVHQTKCRFDEQYLGSPYTHGIALTLIAFVLLFSSSNLFSFRTSNDRVWTTSTATFSYRHNCSYISRHL